MYRMEHIGWFLDVFNGFMLLEIELQYKKHKLLTTPDYFIELVMYQVFSK